MSEDRTNTAAWHTRRDLQLRWLVARRPEGASVRAFMGSLVKKRRKRMRKKKHRKMLRRTRYQRRNR